MGLFGEHGACFVKERKKEREQQERIILLYYTARWQICFPPMIGLDWSCVALGSWVDVSVGTCVGHDVFLGCWEMGALPVASI